MKQNLIADQWVPIAKTGKYAQGNLTTELFDDLVNNFKPEVHEPPLTIGHITKDHNSKPAMGWISGLKREGEILFKKSKQVADDLVNWVKDGRYKKRSIGIREDAEGRSFLHHVAYLGSAVPACKGLDNIYEAENNYSDRKAEGQIEVDFAEDHKKFKQYFKKQEPRKMTKEFSETELEFHNQKIADKAKADIEKEYSEKKKNAYDEAKAEGVKETEDKLKKEFAESEKATKAKLARNSEIDKFYDEGLKKGHISPAMGRSGLKELLYSLSEVAEVNYSDGKSDQEKSQLEILQNVIKSYSATPDDGMISEPENTNTDPKGNPDYVEEKNTILKKQASMSQQLGRNVTYGEAMKEVLVEKARNK